MTTQLVGPSGDSAQRVIAFPIDGSAHSDRAYQWYVDNLKGPDDKCLFINVAEADYSGAGVGLGMGVPPPDLQIRVEENIEQGRNLCQQNVTRAKNDNIAAEGIVLLNNRPGQALVNVINTHGAELVVMGNRGIGTLRRTFLGSVSDYVLHHSQKTVVIVPPEK